VVASDGFPLCPIAPLIWKSAVYMIECGSVIINCMWLERIQRGINFYSLQDGMHQTCKLWALVAHSGRRNTSTCRLRGSTPSAIVAIYFYKARHKCNFSEDLNNEHRGLWAHTLPANKSNFIPFLLGDFPPNTRKSGSLPTFFQETRPFWPAEYTVDATGCVG
jgi:hypothetical protein